MIVLRWMIRAFSAWVTLRWLVLVMMAWTCFGTYALVVSASVAVFGSAAGAIFRNARGWWPLWAFFLPIRDYAWYSELRPGHRLMIEMGLLGEDDAPRVVVFDRPRNRREPVVLGFQAPSARVDVAMVTKAADRAIAHMNSVEAHVTQPEAHLFRVEWWREPKPNLLGNLAPLDAPFTFDGDFSAVPYGWKESTGEVASLKVKECSGTVVGGLPGGGKTAGLSALMSPLVSSPAVQFAIFDGKAGHDWSWLQPRAAIFNRDDEDRAKTVNQLESLVQIMRHRLDEMPKMRAGSSLWTTGGPSEDLPLIVVLIDECQTIFDKALIQKADKEGHALRDRAEAAVATLVRKGRSAGVWVIVTTQKPTSDSLPTTIGSNAANAVCFGVKTPEAEKAVMGSGPAEGHPSATDLPAMPGYAVVGTESGDREVVRFAYVPEQILAEEARRYAALRMPLGQIEQEAA